MSTLNHLLLGTSLGLGKTLLRWVQAQEVSTLQKAVYSSVHVAFGASTPDQRNSVIAAK